MPPVLPFFVLPLHRIFLLAIAYVVAGRLALLLAIPPGFATAIFPPLGISLAAVLLWGNPMLAGVFLGAVLLNTSIAISGGAGFSLAIVSVAIEIALGSCFATWTGATLIRKWVGFPNHLLDEWSIFLFFILGAPIASSLSATIGVTALFLNGIIPPTQIVYSWVTWWTGDAIGVLIATPFVLILFAQPRSFWRNRLKTVGIPLLLSCALIVSIFINSSHNEQQKIERTFQENAREISDRLFVGFSKNISALTPLKGFYIASEKVNAENFRVFTSELLAGASGVTALSWNEKVTRIERKDFERRLIDEGFRDFYIAETNGANEVIPAKEKDDYIVVTYVEPYGINTITQGLNITAEPIRQSALMLANTTGAPAMTAPLRLVQGKKAVLGYLIFMPVYKTLDVPKTAVMREQLVRGYVTALVKVNQQVEALYAKFSKTEFTIHLQDITDLNGPIDLYQDQVTSSPLLNSYAWEEQQNIAGRTLRLRITPTEQFIDKHRSGQSWYVLVGGLLFCSLLGGFLLLVTGRTQYIAALVERRTLELESILDGAVEAIIIVNETGSIERANPAAYRLFKMRDGELLGFNAELIIPLFQNLLFSSGTNSSNHPRDQLALKSVETIGVCADGIKVPIEIGVSQVNLPDRTLYTCLIHDIDARKKVDKLKNEFVSTVSHELRTPLTSITGALGILVGGVVPGIPNKAMDLLVIAKNNAQRLGRLVNDILDIEKLEFGKLQLDIAVCDANHLMQQSIDQNSGYAVKYGVHLALDNLAIATKKINVLVDADRFLQVMSNLISNAIKFSHMGGIVTLSAQMKDGYIIFYIEDHGMGISEEFRRKIFQKFAQADSSDTRKRDGTGLGLSISRVIVERMGGTIDYTSEVNKGSVFFFSIPVEHIE
jgi:PAS domain S-box-containing protein